MTDEIDINVWQDFLKARSVDQDLSRTERSLFLEYFCSPNEDDFAQIRRLDIAQRMFPESTEPENLCAKHLTEIYRKFGFGKNKINQDMSRKALLLFHFLRNEYQKQGIVSTSKSAGGQLNDFLMYLNYHLEEAQFHADLATTGQCGVFFIEIDGEPTQSWLVNRLISKNPVLKAAHRKYVKVTPIWKTDENAVWQWIAGKDFDQNNSQAILEKLSNECQNKTLLLSMCGMESLRGADLEYILKNFWLPLQFMLEKALPDSRQKCVFLLVGQSGWMQNNKACFEVKNENEIHFKLDELKYVSTKILPKWSALSSNHLTDWFRGENVQNFCEQQSGMSYQNLCELLEINSNNGGEPVGSPYAIIETICSHVLSKDNGIAELEPYWKIAS